jgi:hypothetical protein
MGKRNVQSGRGFVKERQVVWLDKDERFVEGDKTGLEL